MKALNKNLQVGLLEIKHDDYSFLCNRVIELERNMEQLQRLHMSEILEDEKPKKMDWDEIGYTDKQLKKVIPKSLIKRFNKWMYGQTCGVKDNGEVVTYKWDVDRFLDLQKTGKKESVGEWD
jgi:hypothetical protein